MSQLIFDTKSLIKCKDKASKAWDKHNFIFIKFAEVFFEKLKETNIGFKNILLISSDFDETYKKLINFNFQSLTYLSQYKSFLDKLKVSKKNVFKKLKNLDYLEKLGDNQKYDLIICNFNFHNINNKLNYSQNLHKLLLNDGILFCNFFGENSLFELRNSLIKTDEKIFKGVFSRMPPTLKMMDASNIFSSAGFKEIVSEIINYDIYYENVKEILKDINGIGENSCFIHRKKSLLSRNYMKTLNNIYSNEYINSDSLLKATCNIVSITMWKKNQ